MTAAKPRKRRVPPAPKKLSAAIRLALEDLKWVEKNPRYRVNMEIYHMPIRDKCNVCFAGAVMAHTHHLDRDLSLAPHNFPPSWSRVFRALNSVRRDYFSEALYFFTIPSRREELYKKADYLRDRIRGAKHEYYSYGENSAAFKAWAAEVADILEKEGF